MLILPCGLPRLFDELVVVLTVEGCLCPLQKGLVGIVAKIESLGAVLERVRLVASVLLLKLALLRIVKDCRLGHEVLEVVL